MLEMNLMHYTYAGRETSRLGTRVLGPWKIMDTADGQSSRSASRRISGGGWSS